MIKKNVHFILLGIITLAVFRTWFMPGLISAGDFWFYFPSMYSQFDLFMFSWSWIAGSGLGSPAVLYQAVNLSFGIPVFLLGRVLGLNWEVIERFGFFYPFLGLGIFSSYYLSKKLLDDVKDNFLWIISVLIFLFNTYILTVVAGGQMLIGLAYSVTPLVLFFFLKVLNQNKSFAIKDSIIAGIVLSIQAVLDVRIAYVASFALLLLFVFKLDFNDFKLSVRKLFYGLIIPFGVAGLLNAFWVLPVIMLGSNPLDQLGGAYNTVGALKFFSFAKFETAISLLHPNWPENIFGKTYFMRSEFLLIPVLAFASLLFVKKDKYLKTFLFLISLSLLGVFLSKGSNDPFGFIYVWMFENLPGFVMFRDPTKWYLLTALSYSILIPFTVYNLISFLKQPKFKKFNLHKFVISLVFIYLIFLIKPALSGEIKGTLKATELPLEYQKLERYLSGQKEFFRTLWIPGVQRFGYYSNHHPAIPAKDFLAATGSSEIIADIQNPENINMLKEGGVKYIIVPFDSHEEIFIKDRKYDAYQYEQAIRNLDNLDFLKRVSGFGRIAVFEVPGYKDHIWSPNSDMVINYKHINPSKYEVQLKHANKGDILIFSESYNSNWSIQYNTFNISSVKFNSKFNSFKLPESGDYRFSVYFKSQKWTAYGLIISMVSLTAVSGILVFNKRK